MHERNESDERRPGSERAEGAPETAALPGQESLAWIRALANAWEDEGHPDHHPDHRHPATESVAPMRARRAQ